jgi:hypothetical protein
MSEGCEAVDLLEDAQVQPGRGNSLETTKGLVVLSEMANDLLGGVVGGGDEMAINGIDQAGPVAL